MPSGKGGYMRDTRGARLDDLAVTPAGESHRSSAMFARVQRQNPFTLQNATNTGFGSWDTLVADTSGIWSSSARTRLTIPEGAGGYWKGCAQITFPAASGGSREVSIHRIFDPSNPTQRSRVARMTLPANPDRDQMVRAEFPPLPCIGGQYFEVDYYQSSGSSMAGITGQTTFFSIERVGDLRGRWAGCGFSSDLSYRGDWSIYEESNGALIEEVGLSVAPDPIHPERLVGLITATHENNSVLYPRVQARTPATIASGDTVYAAFSVLVPESTHEHLLAVRAADGESPLDGYYYGFNLHEIYGPPSGTMSPNRMRYDCINGLTLNAYTGPVGAGTVVQTWNLPPEDCVGRWIDVVFVAKMSTDDEVGYHELYINDGSGRTLQTLSDGVQTGTRYYLATILADVNDGGNNYSSLKVSFGNESDIEEIKVYVTDHRLGSSILVGGESSVYRATA